MAQRIDEADISPLIARKIAARASRADEAIVVGNRAGVIEWANAAWTKVTGYAVDDAISKPIGWMLDAADVEPSVVDFVQRHFLGGRRCEVEFPVTTPDGRSLWLHLEVEPFKDSLGEISDFVATATDITTRRAGEIALESRIAEALADTDTEGAVREPDPDAVSRAESDIAWLRPTFTLARVRAEVERLRGPHTAEGEASVLEGITHRIDSAFAATTRVALERDAVDLMRRTTWLCADRVERIPGTLGLDRAFAPHLPDAWVDPAGFDELVGDLLDTSIDAIGTEWGTISLTTGVAEPGLALASTVDPTLDRFPLTTDRPHVFLEMHDTAMSLSRSDQRFIATRGGARPSGARPLAYALAAARAERLGGALRVHSVPGVGTRVVIYLPMH